METERFRRRNLPHWDKAGVSYFVTGCLADSIPADGFEAIRILKESQESLPIPAGMDETEWQSLLWKKRFVELEKWLDTHPNSKALEDNRLAAIVRDAMLFFAGSRYDLFGFVIMPSHYHWLYKPKDDFAKESEQLEKSSRERIQYSRARYSATHCNQVLGMLGQFWQKETHDHWVRDAAEFDRILAYIEGNPVKAGLCRLPEEWVYSSAHWRRERGLSFGAALLP